MKLPDFLNDNIWNGLRQHMKAELIEFGGGGWIGINTNELFEKLLTSGVDVAFEEINFENDGTFSYQGHRVLVYIRDQRFNPRYDKEGKEYKFHICNCKTLQDFAAKDQLNRYVVSRKTDGKFLINIYNTDTRQYNQKGIYKELKVCKNCLLELKYKGYASHSTGTSIYDNFNLNDFFETHKKPQFTVTPTYSAEEAPDDIYSNDFVIKSQNIRQSNNWHCSVCSLNLKDNKNFLHTHHRNGIKSDDRPTNLLSICLGCHAEQLGHERMKFTAEYVDFMRKYGPNWKLLRSKIMR